MNKTISDLLFETNAIQICHEDEPFFYTSGKIGPYYINTHFLFGGKDNAQLLLNNMEKYKKDLIKFPRLVFNDIKNCYINCEIYQIVIDLVCKKAKEFDFDYISGGERRDFFFSMMPSYILKKPHVTILKDMTVLISDSNFENSKVVLNNELEGKKVLHIADLVTQASSYLRAWIPAINKLGGKIENSIAIVDRNQGGKDILQEKDIRLHAFTKIDNIIFAKALEKEYINKNQYKLIIDFIDNPDKFMYEFFANNPSYLQDQINIGGKNKQRALLCIENNFHKE